MAYDYYDILGITKEELHALADHYGIERLALFGSYARGEQDQESDVDLLVEWGAGKQNRFRAHMGLIEALSQATGRNIDLTTPEALHWYIKDKVIEESKDLL